MYRLFLNVTGFCFLMILFACADNSRTTMLTGHMSGYNNETRVKKNLKPELSEISGIVFLNDGQKIASVNDEDGLIFISDFSGKDTTTSFSFAPKGDFEEIVMDSKYFYVLESRGRIYKVPRPGVQDTVTIFKMGMKNADFEAMYMDSANKRLVLICKSCPDYEKNKTKPAFCFDLTTNQFSEQPCLVIDVKQARKLLKNDYFGAKPSGAAIHPKLNKVFIVCSQDGKGLLICDLEGNIEQAILLDEAMFPQPEGITFAPNGDMYISNEGLYQPGSIIYYPYKKMN